MLLRFADLLALARARAQSLDDEGVLSLAVPLAPLDPLPLLPLLPEGDGFRFLWDGAPGLCLAAAGRCQSLELSGPRRFELAQRFAGLCLHRLGANEHSRRTWPAAARPRVLLAFGFFDTPLEGSTAAVPGVQAVLPRWQLSRHGQHCWLRLQATLGGAVTARSLAEELWETASQLQQATTAEHAFHHGATVHWSSPWQQQYGAALERGLELVDSGGLTKLVLAVRQQLHCDRPLDPLELIPPLRQQQAGSCRLLWQRHSGTALVGASPERLLTVRQGQLRCDALAGTTAADHEASALLRSSKDRHEHELVVEAIAAALQREGLSPRRPRHPRLARHGHLAHLHTPITAELGGQHPLAVAAALHPTPAVAGLPRREAMAWLRSLEPFERGHYAAPIGWIDSEGDTDLRVAIRCGMVQGHGLELTAGAGLVRGSQWQRELNEVGLKLQVLQKQLSVPAQESPAVSQPAAERG
ncbi:MAG: isochorismate synthase [Cyanobacteria bacterium M_surface_7_m2_040]|nr:isochorismate synthase [Cyanobacteria bacterium M_surface_7_m2_040]